MEKWGLFTASWGLFSLTTSNVVISLSPNGEAISSPTVGSGCLFKPMKYVGAKSMAVEMGTGPIEHKILLLPEFLAFHSVLWLTLKSFFCLFFCSLTLGNAFLSSAITTVFIVSTHVSIYYHSQWQNFLAAKRQFEVQLKKRGTILKGLWNELRAQWATARCLRPQHFKQGYSISIK